MAYPGRAACTPQGVKIVAWPVQQLHRNPPLSILVLMYSYIVVVKVGKPSETNRPGNRGKRDSQVLLMQYLNRVHFDAPMSPLELEIYHQMRNVIGIDPTFYEYIFQVDADTVSTTCRSAVWEGDQSR